MTPVADASDAPETPHARRPSATHVLVLVLVAACAVVLVRALLVQSFVVPTASMEPTVAAGDRVIVSRVVRWFGEVHRGDVVVFDGAGIFGPPTPEPRNGLAALGRGLASAVGVPVGRQDYVKRVIGLPGDRVACCDDRGAVTVNGVALTEPYLAAGTAPSEASFDVQVPADKLWMMGDNRGDSADSRAHLGDHGGGMVPVDRVVGTVVAVWWPLDRTARVDSAVLDDRVDVRGGGAS